MSAILLSSFNTLIFPLISKKLLHKKHSRQVFRTSLVVQLLRIHLPMLGTQVLSLVREDPTCYVAAKPMHHNC